MLCKSNCRLRSRRDGRHRANLPERDQSATTPRLDRRYLRLRHLFRHHDVQLGELCLLLRFLGSHPMETPLRHPVSLPFHSDLCRESWKTPCLKLGRQSFVYPRSTMRQAFTAPSDTPSSVYTDMCSKATAESLGESSCSSA